MTAKKSAIAAILSALVMALSACSGSESAGGENGLAKEGVLHVGDQISFPPLIYYKEGTKQIQGVDYDIMLAIGEELGARVEFTNTEFESLIPGVDQGRWDATMTMFITPEREKVIDQISYLQARGGMLIRKGDDLGSFEELCGRPVTYQQGSLYEGYVDDLIKDCSNRGEEPPRTVETSGSAESKQALTSGRADAYLTDLPISLYVAKTSGGGKQFDVVKKPYGAQLSYGIGVYKGNEQLSDAIVGALKKIIKNGTYQKILKKHGLEELAIDEPVLNPRAEL